MQANHYMQSPDGFTFRTTNPEWHKDCTKLSAKAGKAAELAQSLDTLHKYLKPGNTVYTVLRHVSTSGMMRRIDCYVMFGGKPAYISGHVAHVLGYPSPENGIKVSGCGMDMGFHLVYNLSSAMFRDGFECIGKGCPSNNHSNGDRNYEPHRHSGGGYALRHEWI